MSDRIMRFLDDLAVEIEVAGIGSREGRIKIPSDG